MSILQCYKQGSPLFYKNAGGNLVRAFGKEVKRGVQLLVTGTELVTPPECVLWPTVGSPSLHSAIIVDDITIGDFSFKSNGDAAISLTTVKDPLFFNFTDGTLEYYFKTFPGNGLVFVNNQKNGLGLFSLVYSKSSSILSGYIDFYTTSNQRIWFTNIPMTGTEFNHITLTCKDKVFTLWVNGVDKGSVSLPPEAIHPPGYLFYNNFRTVFIYSASDLLGGIRGTVGQALYTEEFIPSFLPFTREAVGAYESV